MAFGPQGVPSPVLSAALCGDGSDGSLVISSGFITLSRNMNYSSITITGAGRLLTNGAIVRCNGPVNLSSAPSHAICNCFSLNPATGIVTAANNATGATGGATNSDTGGNLSCPIPEYATGGANGGTGVGTVATAATASPASPYAVASVAGAAGGLGSSGAGGAAAAGVSYTPSTAFSGGQLLSNLFDLVINTSSFLTSPSGTGPRVGGCGPGGSSGAGDGTNPGGGGGGGANVAGWTILIAQQIITSASTGAGVIGCVPQVGGNGGTPSAGNCGGGGGGGGAAGNPVLVICGTRVGPTGSFIELSGSNGGNGGNGVGSGVGGYGGNGGQTGFSIFRNVGANTIAVTGPATAGTTGSAGSGNTGGTGGLGAVLQATM